MSSALVDSSTLIGVGRCFQNIYRQNTMREPEFRCLDYFLEAYVLNDHILVNEGFWDYLITQIPEVNRDQFAKVVRAESFDLSPVLGLTDFIESELVFNMALLFEVSPNLIQNHSTIDYDQYWNYAEGKQNTNTHKGAFELIENKFSAYWKLDEKDMFHYFGLVNAIVLAYRTVNYLQIAESKQMNLITHDTRSTFLSLTGKDFGANYFDQPNLALYKEISARASLINRNNAFKEIMQKQKSGEIIENTAKIPFLPALIYEQSNGIGEIFMVAEKMRSEFKPFRETINEIDALLEADDFQRADKIQHEINAFLENMVSAFQGPSQEWSFSAGLPLSLSIGLARKSTVPHYLKVFKNFMNRYSLPESYFTSRERLFGRIQPK